MNSILPDSPIATTLAVALFAFTAATARAEVEDKITKSFTVDPGGQLVVAADRGTIEIQTADAGSVNLEVTRKAGGSRSKAEQTLKDHVVTATQDGNKVEVRAKYTGEKASGLFGRSPELQVKYLLTIPRQFDVDLKTSGGHIQIAELTGKVAAHTSGGHLELKKLEGPVSGHTSGGNITLDGCKGKVDLGTSGGHVELREIEGDVTANTSGGSIKADQLTGKSILKTSGGHIEVAGMSGSVAAKTSGGHITVTLSSQPASDCSFETSGGSITIALAGNVAAEVDARTSGGHVSTELPVVAVVHGQQKKTELHGKINGGGPLLTARTSGGNVRLEKK